MVCPSNKCFWKSNDSWSLTSEPRGRYKISELFAALNGNSPKAWHRTARPDPCDTVLLFASRALRLHRYAGAIQIHRPRLLRGHQLPRQREARGGQPQLSERIFDVDFAGQAQ